MCVRRRDLLPLPVAHLSGYGERVGVRGGNMRRSQQLPLTLTLSPLRGGEREQCHPINPASAASISAGAPMLVAFAVEAVRLTRPASTLPAPIS